MNTVKTNLTTLMAIMLCIVSISAFGNANKEKITKEDRIKSLVIFSMTKYVQWPDGSNELVIGILSDDKAIVNLFTEIATERSTFNKKVTVKPFTSITAAAMASDILFIPNEKSTAFAEFDNMNIKHVLVITEKEGLGKQGSSINLITVDGKLRFEINREAVERSGLKISSKLTEMSIEV